MPLLSFDASGSISSEFGITENQIDSLSAEADTIRRQLSASEFFGGDSDLESERMLQTFFGLPERQHAEYLSVREESDLGHVFRIANGLHDHIDSVAVIGNAGNVAVAQALMQACCEPFHNELSRAERGSKPRLYFGGDSLDNDACESLLRRIKAGGYGDTPAEKRFAIVVVGADDEMSVINGWLHNFIQVLRTSLGETCDAWLPRLVIPISQAGSELDQFATELSLERVFCKSSLLCNSDRALAPVSLLPAAMLGLDCMKLLQGAAEINEHFRSARYRENVVLQFAAVNHLLRQHRQVKTCTVLSWVKALAGFSRWYDLLVSQHIGRPANPISVVGDGVMTSNTSINLDRKRDCVMHQLVVHSTRTDPVMTGQCMQDPAAGTEKGKMSMQDGLISAIGHSCDQLRSKGCCTTKLLLPAIDTYYMGQLLQMMMLATKIESELG